jgi:2-dehydro-3-deoxyphosphogluconate aldolase / (4S)-4-hydroxy-2-oxoglutarate aldolase
MKSLFPDSVLADLHQTGVVAVLILDDPRIAVHVAKALADGGVTIIELTLRTPAASDCLRAIRAEVPETAIGAGTILSRTQADQALQAGAGFGVSPGTNPEVIRHATEIGLPFAPGVMTPTDIDRAVECGCRELKFFPAQPSGGLPFLRCVAAPFQHLKLQFIPLGGINEQNLGDWLEEPSVLAVGGSWLVPAAAVRSGDWNAITRLATNARQIVQKRTH